MIPVAEALARVLALADLMPSETVPLTQALGRVLAEPQQAGRDQPPFSASAMDGYGVAAGPVAVGDRFHVIGEAAAGHRFDAPCGAGEAVRIFTGAPLPEGVGQVIIQENTARDGDHITLTDLPRSPHIRAAGADFRAGDRVDAPRLLGPADLALLAAMNLPDLPVRRRPRVALMATGDELVPPGGSPGPDQIIASNSYGLHALAQQAGADPHLIPIARDTPEALRAGFAACAGADLIVTIGGASVGDHDLVGDVAADLGLERAFYKVRMRPGKPLMAGRLGGVPLLGLPGNPVSAMVCGHLFMGPLLRAMQGLPAGPAPRMRLPLTAAMEPNGDREHYLRARRDGAGVAALPSQDSALLSVLAQADCLIVRPPQDPPHAAGDLVEVIALS